MSEITSINTVKAALSWSAGRSSSEIPFRDEYGKIRSCPEASA